MIVILPAKQKSSTEDIHKDIPDYPFMKASKEILDNIPNTWKQYPDTLEGRCNIITMEYNELMNTRNLEEKSHELVHLASACLHLWRQINGK